MQASTAAGLVGAAMLSTLVYPFVGLALRKGGEEATRRRRPPDAGPPRSESGPSPSRRWLARISFRRL